MLRSGFFKKNKNIYLAGIFPPLLVPIAQAGGSWRCSTLSSYCLSSPTLAKTALWQRCVGVKVPVTEIFGVPSGSLRAAIYLPVSSFQKTCKMSWEEVKKVKGKYLRRSALEQRL